MRKENLRIVFMGTPEFAVESLKRLVNEKCNVVGVITAPDKPAGRGQQIQQSPVKKYAIENNLTVLQPEKLKDPIFLQQLKNLSPELQIIVAFRMLPEVVWNMPEFGTFNIHASLLPQYRGAAPINWAIINGEKETGVTSFFLQQEIDTGKVVFQSKILISDKENAGTLHDKLMLEGADIAIKTVRAIESGNFSQTDQSLLGNTNILLKAAPKLYKENCIIDWTQSADSIYNFIRGLCPYPSAWTELLIDKKEKCTFKIFESEIISDKHNFLVPQLIIEKKRSLKVAVKDGFINVLSLQQAGKKRLGIDEFLRGFNFSEIEIINK